jgi:hypothetical protein
LEPASGNVRRVVDDTLLYAKTLEEAYDQMVSYLILVSSNGIMLNPEMFLFGEESVDWAGVRLTKDEAEPLPSHVQSIRDFLTPKNLMDKRSYFALVEQVAPYYAVKQELYPFREFLKKNSKWFWHSHLQKLFDDSREIIADKVIEVNRRFDVNWWTAVMTDWSESGLGFLLLEKWCGCSNITPVCGKGGWVTCSQLAVMSLQHSISTSKESL